MSKELEEMWKTVWRNYKIEYHPETPNGHDCVLVLRNPQENNKIEDILFVTILTGKPEEGAVLIAYNPIKKEEIEQRNRELELVKG